MTSKSPIPIYDQGKEAIGGMYIAKLARKDAGVPIDKLNAHRDNFYIFFLLLKGSITMKCDGIDVEIDATSISIVSPLQVHSTQNISADAAGYFISVAPFLIPAACVDVFQNLKILQQVKKIKNAQKKDLLDIISMLHRSFNSLQSNKTQISVSLLNAFNYHLIDIFRHSEQSAGVIKNQSAIICGNFKKLLLAHSFLNPPSYFANKLHISVSHLNDCVKFTTGKSVTYWLQHAMFVEAQRLLYYTEMDVKEVAFALGFSDHRYFSRLFKKIAQETPLTFRAKFRE